MRERFAWGVFGAVAAVLLLWQLTAAAVPMYCACGRFGWLGCRPCPRSGTPIMVVR